MCSQSLKSFFVYVRLITYLKCCQLVVAFIFVSFDNNLIQVDEKKANVKSQKLWRIFIEIMLPRVSLMLLAVTIVYCVTVLTFVQTQPSPKGEGRFHFTICICTICRIRTTFEIERQQLYYFLSSMLCIQTKHLYGY